jgi:dihydrofolate reductase
MGKVVNSTFVSLDGVINHMDRWHFDFIDGEADSLALRQLLDSDTLLMGHRTYDAYASAWPGRDGEYADRINAMPKYVASTTLRAPEWTNTAVLDGDLVDAVTASPTRGGLRTSAAT